MLLRYALLALALVPSIALAQPPSGPDVESPIVLASDPRCVSFDDPVRWRTPRIPDARPRLVLEHTCLQLIEARLRSEETPGLVPLGAALVILGAAGALTASFVAAVAPIGERTFGSHGNTWDTAAGVVGGVAAGLLVIGGFVLTFGLESSARVGRRLVAGRRVRIEQALMHLVLSPDGASLAVAGSF